MAKTDAFLFGHSLLCTVPHFVEVDNCRRYQILLSLSLFWTWWSLSHFIPCNVSQVLKHINVLIFSAEEALFKIFPPQQMFKLSSNLQFFRCLYEWFLCACDSVVVN